MRTAFNEIERAEWWDRLWTLDILIWALMLQTPKALCLVAFQALTFFIVKSDFVVIGTSGVKFFKRE